MTNTVRVEGLTALLTALEGLESACRRDLRQVAKKAAKPTLIAARQEVPVKTGALRASLRITNTTRGVAVKAGSGKVPYAKVIHFGWPKHHVAANQFLFRAVDKTADAVAAEYMAELVRLWEEGLR